jgi:predicted  nucleic acid-binding Zn-ribbon protein
LDNLKIKWYLRESSERKEMSPITKKDMLDTLSEFYGKFIEPEFKGMRSKLDGHDQHFKDLLEHFDRIYTRFDRLETEYFSITAAVGRIEQRLDGIQTGMEKTGEKLDIEISFRDRLEKEIGDLKHRVSTLQDRIEELEKRLKTFS